MSNVSNTPSTRMLAGKILCALIEPFVCNPATRRVAWALYTAARNTLRSGENIERFLSDLAYWLDQAEELEGELLTDELEDRLVRYTTL